MTDFRVIPSIERLRQRAVVRALEAHYGREAVVSALREEAATLRQGLEGGTAVVDTSEAAAASIEGALEDRLRRALAGSLRRIVNATGVIIHTNLGRAPLPSAALTRIAQVAAGYSNLEYDLELGTRGSRSVHADRLLRRLTGAEAAAVVNNNAAAVLITLASLAAGREVIISRGELVEIGGGFRVPDVMRQSGAELREVGTTNKTRAADYAAAISERTAAILRVHPSNFRIEGFTERPRLHDLVALARRFGVLVIEDLGSGNLLDFRTGIGDQGSGIGDQATIGSGPRPPTPGPRPPIPDLLDEPLVTDSIEAGVDICCFSGDKLLGGPQAGIIIGRRDSVEKIRRHPLMRALRVDKLTYAALEGTLLEYASGHAATRVPVARMLATPVEELQRRAETMTARVSGHQRLHVQVIDGHSTLGGGSAPGMTISSRVLAITVEGLSANGVETRLRQADPPIIGRIEHDCVLLDVRTIQPDEDEIVARALESLAQLQ